MKDQDGRPLRVETLPMPDPVYFDGQRLPASYANFYIANRWCSSRPSTIPATASRSIRWRTYSPIAKSSASPAAIWSSGLGTLHCMTQQQPA